MAIDAKHLVKLSGFGGDFLGFLAGFGVFAGFFVGMEAFADDFKFKIELFRKFENHKATPEDCRVMGVAVGVGVFGLDMDVGLREGDVFVFARGEVIGAVAVAGVNHAGEAEERATEAGFVAVIEVGEGFLEILFNKVCFVSAAIITLDGAVGKSHDNEIDKCYNETIKEQHEDRLDSTICCEEYCEDENNGYKNTPLPS